MFNKKTIVIILSVELFIVGAGFGQTLEDNWGEFLHYLIVRLDMAKGYAQAILQSNPDPVQLHALAKANPQGYEFLLRASENEHDAELAELSGQILDLIEEGGFIRRTDPAVMFEEIKRLSINERGWLIATQRLSNAGEYAIPLMLDALMDPTRQDEFNDIVRALPIIGRDAVRPLVVALQINNIQLKDQIIQALGEIRYSHSLPYLKYIVENDSSELLRTSARNSISRINPDALEISAAQLFYQLAEQYYYHAESLRPAEDADFANIWFWNPEDQELGRQEVDHDYFYELMAMRACEWALRADAGFGSAIGMWLAAYFKAESIGIDSMSEYFGNNHPDALMYATTAGVEYLHEALARAIKDNNAYVALGLVEALSRTAGEKSLLYKIGTEQPLIQALSFNDKMVRYSAAIAIAAASPQEYFAENKLVVANLAEALNGSSQPGTVQTGLWSEEIADSYAFRAAMVMLELARTRNPVIDLSLSQDVLINSLNDERTEIRILASQTLSYLTSPVAQQAIAQMALDTGNTVEVRVSAFSSLATSAKLNTNMLTEEMVDGIYDLINSDQTNSDIRNAAAIAYGALNLPSRKVKDLILDQAKS